MKAKYLVSQCSQIQYLANKSKTWRGPPPKEKSKGTFNHLLTYQKWKKHYRPDLFLDKKSKKDKKKDDDKDSSSRESKSETNEKPETIVEATEAEGITEPNGAGNVHLSSNRTYMFEIIL